MCFRVELSKRTVRFLVPDPFVLIRKIAIPKDINEEEIRGYIYGNWTSIHMPFEEPEFDYFLQENSDSETNDLLLFAAPENVILE
ncbi:hypothetical protein V7152_19980 [Neobacillus drentensis]|uniref:hypothetical protein n=1 Tax=Neobacillus drentensis TaxID=220684 RepID=UPI002FFDB462